MRKDLIGKAGVAAVIILAPGGFVLGLALLVRRYRGSSRSEEQTTTRPAPQE